MFLQVVSLPLRNTGYRGSSRKRRCISFYLIKMAVCIIIGFPEAVFAKNVCKTIPVFPLAVGKATPAPRNESIRDAQAAALAPVSGWSPRPSAGGLRWRTCAPPRGGRVPRRAASRILRRQTAPLWQGRRSPKVGCRAACQRKRARHCRVELWMWLRFRGAGGGGLFLNKNVKTVKVEKLHLKL